MILFHVCAQYRASRLYRESSRILIGNFFANDFSGPNEMFNARWSDKGQAVSFVIVALVLAALSRIEVDPSGPI